MQARHVRLLVIVLLGLSMGFVALVPAEAQPTVVNFDTPPPPGASGALLNGVFEGIDFGLGQWRWEAGNVNPTNHIFFDSGAGTARTFQFDPGPRIVVSVTVFTLTAGTLTLSAAGNPDVVEFIDAGPDHRRTITTNWEEAVTTVTVAFEHGWAMALDDIASEEGGPGPALAPVVQTGQTQCSDATGAFIVCAGTGQDGDLQAGVVPPTPRFTDNTDGTVTDNLTGLIWLQDANCFGLRDWQTALTDANGLSSGSCGLTDGSVAGDWRLPNVKELQSLIDFGNFPALPTGHPFSGLSFLYWSSTPYAPHPSGVWVVNLISGTTDRTGKGNAVSVWPVRGGL